MGLSRDRLSDEELLLEKVKGGFDNVKLTSDQVSPQDFHKLVGVSSPGQPQGIDNVNHPPHYNNSQAKCECGRRIECIDVTRHLNFNIGNAIKYLWRCDLKNSSIEDLRKAVWYIQDEIKQRVKS